MPGEFSGKVVIITGGNRGIGREIAIDFARAGAHKSGFQFRSSIVELLLLNFSHCVCCPSIFVEMANPVRRNVGIGVQWVQ